MSACEGPVLCVPPPTPWLGGAEGGGGTRTPLPDPTTPRARGHLNLVVGAQSARREGRERAIKGEWGKRERERMRDKGRVGRERGREREKNAVLTSVPSDMGRKSQEVWRL